MSVILGLNAGHNSSITIIKNGRLHAFCGSENLTGIKDQGAIFGAHIERLLSEASLAISDVDCIAIASTQSREVLSGDGFKSSLSFVCNGLNLKIDQFSLQKFCFVYKNRVMDSFASNQSSNPHFHQFPQLFELYRRSGWPSFFSRNIASYIAEHPQYLEKFPFRALKLDDGLLNRCLYPIKMSLLGKTISGFFVSHHLAHSFSVHAKSPFSNNCPVLILTADGGGCGPEGNMISIS